MSSRKWELFAFAHNEAKHIGSFLDLLDLSQVANQLNVHVIENGSTDNTHEVAQEYAKAHPNLFAHSLDIGDKANAWNYAVHSINSNADVYFFADADVRINLASLNALADQLNSDSSLNCASAVPGTGRNKENYQEQMAQVSGVQGCLYALSKDFVSRIRENNIHLPTGIVGDDSLVGCLASTDLGHLKDWDSARIKVCPEAHFDFDSVNPLNIGEAKTQFQRMIRYSIRHFENKMIGEVLKKGDASALPNSAHQLHADNQECLQLTWRGPLWTPFDWLAIRRIQNNLNSK